LARILIAEDANDLGGLLARARQGGHTVMTANDGAAALAGARAGGLRAAADPYPHADDGALALATARDHPGIIVLLMTTRMRTNAGAPRS
jgi:DNA-binding response OmpR family regulator